MDNTETKEMEGEQKFNLVKKTLNALYVQVPEEVATDVTNNILPYVIELRSELQNAKEALNQERIKVLEVARELADDEIKKAKELNGELVKIKNLVEELIEVAHFRNQWPTTTEAFESLIKNLTHDHRKG